eukprot:TRINITY_DN18156_c0_g1_i1.p1 TRINITY_DN18156_c0_g1~~TRINITY_DN18156_c0_g1_i1.p1  ORF type:complete len:395 (+),score=117.83 TRINITY_DN18156_c0_g1_i1:87-1271(+)
MAFVKFADSARPRQQPRIPELAAGSPAPVRMPGGSPARSAAALSPNAQRAAKQVELRMLFLEEQLHKVSDGITPDVGEVLSEVVHWKTECAGLARDLKEAKEAAARNEALASRLRSTVSEQAARLLTLQEAEGVVKGSQSSAAEQLKDALVEKGKAVAAARGRAEHAEQALAETTAEYERCRMAAQGEAAQLHEQLLEQEARAAASAQEAAHAAEEIRSLTAAKTALEVKCDKLSAGKLSMKPTGAQAAAHMEARCTALEEEKEALEGAVAKLMRAAEEHAAARAQQDVQHSKQLKANDEKWHAAVASIREEIRRCEEEVRLAAAREQRKSEIIQEYHAALTVIEDERNELLARQAAFEEDEGEAVPFDEPLPEVGDPDLQEQAYGHYHSNEPM